MSVSKITRNYQVTIPQDVREAEGLQVGDNVAFVVEGNHRIHLVKLSKDIIAESAGLWAGIKETGLEYERRLRKEWRKREIK
jgi:AbrB family looped-hinge helix DNA binding protein